MNPNEEMLRLLDLMPASGRMMTRIVIKPEQTKVIDAKLPTPWVRERPIWINIDLWSQLQRSQRDLLLLRTVTWLLGVQWLKPDWYQGVAVAATLGATFELSQADPVGTIMAGGLAALAAAQIWRANRSTQRELKADEEAIRVATRRGYTETDAARALLEAIEAVARIEGRLSLTFTELIRCQNLKAIAGLSVVGVPETVRQERR